MTNTVGRNPDLHGNAPDKSPVALILIDVINRLDFDTGEQLLEHALPMAHNIAALKRRAKALGIPSVYSNDNYFVLKPKHSGFFSTQLDILLDYLGARTLILTGIQATICVLFTANDAYMRDYALVVPTDCVASADPAEAEHALRQMQAALKAQVLPWGDLDLEALVAEAKDLDRSPSAGVPCARKLAPAA